MKDFITHSTLIPENSIGEKAFLTQRRAKCSMVTAQVYRLNIQIFKKAVKRFTNPVHYQSVNDMLNHFRCHFTFFSSK